MEQHRSDVIDFLPRGTNFEFHHWSARPERFNGFTQSIPEHVRGGYEVEHDFFPHKFHDPWQINWAVDIPLKNKVQTTRSRFCCFFQKIEEIVTRVWNYKLIYFLIIFDTLLLTYGAIFTVQSNEIWPSVFVYFIRLKLSFYCALNLQHSQSSHTPNHMLIELTYSPTKQCW